MDDFTPYRQRNSELLVQVCRTESTLAQSMPEIAIILNATGPVVLHSVVRLNHKNLSIESGCL